MSPARCFLYLGFALLFPSSRQQGDGDLLTRIKTLDDPNELWNLLKTASKVKPVEDDDSDLDDLFGNGDEDDDLFKSEENDSQIKPIVRSPDSVYFHLNGQRDVPPSRHLFQGRDRVYIVNPQSFQHAPRGYVPANNGSDSPSFTFSVRRTRRSIPDDLSANVQGSSLVFVFDTTGSMSPELRQVQLQASKIANAMTVHPDKPIYDYVFVPFNDPGVGPVTKTRDHTYFQSILDGIRVDGGGDCPEMSMEGLLLALENSLPRSFIYVFTDASAKDAYLLDKVLNLIQRKQSLVMILLTGDCYDLDDTYTSITKVSNGQVYDLEKTNITVVLDNIKNNLNNRKVNLVNINSNEPAPVPKPYTMPIDENLDEFTVSITGANPKLHVYEPNGTLAVPPKIKDLINLSSVKVVNVPHPEPGEWTIKVGSDTLHTIRSTGLSKSNVKFTYGFSVIPTTNMAETAHRPLQGVKNSLLVKTFVPTSVCRLSHINFLDFEGNVIAKIPLKPIIDEEGLYAGGPVLPPNEYFNMETHGYDSTGNKLVRIFPSAIAPQIPDLPEVNVKPYVMAPAGQDLDLECHVESLVPVTVKWFKDGRLEAVYEYKQSSKSVLNIQNVSRDSAGNYTCWTKNIAGISTKHVLLTVAEAPAIYVVNEVKHHVEAPVQISCRVVSDLPYNVTWSRKESVFSGGHNKEEDLKFFHKNPEEDKQNDYSIGRLKIEDEGWYTCTATNKGGTNKGDTYLKVLSPPILEEPAPIKFSSKVPLVVTCKLARPEPSAKVKWEKKDSRIKTDHITIDGSEDNSYSYQLIIHNPERSDEGFYRCFAENSIGTAMKTVKVVFISEPKIRVDQKEVVTREGSVATLRCTLIDGVPPPTVTWFKRETELISYPPHIKVLEGGSVLVIESVSAGDESKYFCMARNEAGEYKAGIDLQIAVEPSIISPARESRIEVDYRGSLEILCQASGNPAPDIIWSKKLSNTSYEFHYDTLKIEDSQIENEGEYTCHAKNPFGEDEATVYITVTGLEKPVISGNEEEVKIKGLVGQRVELPCVLLAGNPFPNVTWYKDGIRLLPSMYNNVVVLVNGSFIIPVLTLRHIGNYKCQAENMLGSDTKHYSLSTYDAPKMNMSVGSFILAKVGNNVTLPCHLRGDPKPVVIWYKENVLVDRPFRGFRMNDSDNLHISNVNEGDSGRYICKAENIAGIARRAVILSVISAPKILNFPREVSAVSGDVVFLNCPSSGLPRPTIRWLKNNEPLNHVRGSIGNNYLRFFSDPSDSGQYTCIAENKAGEDQATTYLMILEPPKMDETTEDYVEGIVGGRAELPCRVSGTPRPFVIWQHKGQTIKKLISSGNTSVYLQLTNLTEEDKGSYFCIASNKAGSNRRSVELSVLVPPMIEDWDNPIRVIPGDTVTIACKVSGFPKPVVKWMRNDEPLSPEFFAHDNILRFIVESSHSGNYSCFAVNKAGNISKSVHLNVYEAPKFQLEQSEDMEILQDSAVRVPCSAEGDPKPVISWFYNGRILENKNNIRFFQDKDTMLINNIKEEDEGIYECAATNKAGSNSRSIKINVLVPPMMTKWSDDMSVREGNEVILTCEVKGKPEPIVVWKKNGIALPSDFSYRGNKIRFIATASDQGNYSCHASNKVGNDVKYTFLTVKVHPQIIGNLEEDIVVLLGDGLELKCEAKGVPEPTISWNFNSTLINNLPNSAFRLKGVNLFIPAVDFLNAGEYACFAKNILGTAQKIFKVTVHVPPTITDDSHDIITLKEGDDFSISCSSYGVPTPDIFWINEDKIFKKGFHNEHFVVMNDHTLIISNAQVNMSGNYFCVATNIEGSAMKNYTIDVIASQKDTMSDVKNMTLIEIEESDDGVLNCPLSDFPIHWLKDDDGINLSGNERADDIHLQLLDGGRTLKLAEAYTSDSGVYTCFTDQGTSQFFVKVLVRPYFLQEFPQTDFELKQGDQLTLDCNALGNPTPKINWRHVERDIPITKHTVPGVLVKGDEKDTLHFPAVKVHHAGRYMCLASNKVGKEGRLFTVKVTEPPILTGEQEEKITAVAGNILDLDCTVTGSPKPRYSWKHIPTTGKESDLRYNQKKFTINNLKPKDAGIYICNGTNKVGSTVKYFFIFILEAPRITGSELEEIQLPEGKEMEVECEASGVPLPSMTWQLDSRQIDSTRVIVTSTKPQSYGTLTSTLRIKSVDETVAGVYSCLASNDVATAQKHYKLSIIVPPVLSDQSFLFNTKSVDLNEGQAIYLTCPIRQDQLVNIEWYLQVNDSRTSFEKNNNGHLYVVSAKPSDRGVYTCVASNDAGKVEASFIINISEPPLFLSSTYEKTLTLTQDDELILNCSVKSRPQSQIIWLKDGLRITGKRNSLLTLLNHNQTLVISNIKADDSGKYVCIASNRAGSAERSFYANIHEAPNVEGMSSSQISMESNKTATHFTRVILKCPLTGSPQPIIKWFKDGTAIIGSDRIHITPYGVKLIIFYLTEEEAGRYSCTAQNQAGINKLFFNLKVIVPQEWSPWAEWSNCSKACDGGTQFRNRTCGDDPPLKYLRNSYVEYDKSACKGADHDSRICNTYPCKVDGEWGGWSEWGSCSASCGQGTRSRARRCNNPAPAFGGARCRGSHMETSSCTKPPCPIDGQWSGWTEWSECTVSCGGGLKFRERRCNSPAPKDGGRPCPGSYRDVVVCNQQKCPIDGRWTGWGMWNKCSVSCGSGIQVRYRHCYKPLHGGKTCSGSNREVRKCENQPCGNEAYAEALRRSSRVVEKDSVSAEKEVTNVVNDNSKIQISEESERESRLVYLTGSHLTMPQNANSTPSVVSGPETKGVRFLSDVFNNADTSTGSVVFEESYSSYTNMSDDLLTSDEMRGRYQSKKCPTGFRQNKTSNHCQDINECRNKKWNRCRRYKSQCVNTIGSYKCVCGSGFRLVEKPKKKCIDINECKEKIDVCSHFCHNTKGSYKCSCPDGLALLEDSHTCLRDSSDYFDYLSKDEELLSSSTIDSDKSVSEWVDSSDYFKDEPHYQKGSELIQSHVEAAELRKDDDIICPKGFVKQKNQCKDINECNLKLDNCTAEQICINTLGSYNCLDAPCPTNYVLIPSISSCQMDCRRNDSQCSIGTKIAETVTYESYDTENKTLSSLHDIVVLIAYDENKQFINDTAYTVGNNLDDLPVDVRKENNLGILYTTDKLYIQGLHSLDVIGITRSENSSDIIYSQHFVIFLYNSFTVNNLDLE